MKGLLAVSWCLSLAHFSDALRQPSQVQKHVQQDYNYFNWTQVKPSTKLKWQRCYESYECTRLEVPLDWTNTSNPNTVVLALTRVPGAVARDDPSFGGTILFNPGGPSGSGVDEMRWLGYGIRDIVDSDKHFEILSWDPRGVQHTTPSVACFDDHWLRQIWSFKNWAEGLLDSSELAFDVKWAASAGFGKLCGSTEIGVYPDGSNIRQFVSTASTARDMVAIIDALEEEREDEKSALTFDGQHPMHLKSSEPALLNYWGQSYGTFLGNTFASMFPNRIGRMILDGNVDPVDYIQTGWLTNLVDNNKTLDWFLYSCWEAGSDCAFVDKDTASVDDLQSKLWRLLERLKHDPISTVYEGTADIVSYADLARLIHAVSYAPTYHWLDLAQVASDLYEGNATSMIKHLQHLELPVLPKGYAQSHARVADDSYNNKTRPGPPGYPQGLEATRAIMCGDGHPMYNLTKSDWKARLEILNSQSPIAGPLWAELTLLCQNWPASLRPAESNRFTGPFQSNLSDYDPRASPLLFIDNTADPVTPLRNAIKNSAGHEGSHVLIQDSPGHCAGYVNPDECTFQAIKHFFGQGKLPKNSTVCSGFKNPFLR